jgi:7-cyano-7-deazaguanine synthase
MENTDRKFAVLSLSGGMDSSTLLLHLLASGYDVTCLSFDYGQKHKVELERATELVKHLNGYIEVDESSKTFDYPFYIKHQIIKLDGLSSLLNSSLVSGGNDVPEGHYEAENMRETVVPNRNKIFSSIIQAVALSIAEKNNTNCVVALGIHAGDHQIYPDCRQEFRDADYEAFKLGNWGSEKVTYYTPFLEIGKYEILQHGLQYCEQMNLEFNDVYKLTSTSYKPYPSGNSDYKSASSVERIEAFIKLGLPDPITYEDETGVVSWNDVVKHVSEVLSEHKVHS